MFSFSRTGLLFAVLILFVVSCAEIAVPPGGPEDKTPPSIVRVQPSESSLNIPVDSGIEIEFSEYMNRDSVEEALLIQPDPGPYSIRWKGRSLRLRFRVDFADETTYLVSIEPTARDAHGVVMERRFSTGFATGDSLAGGEIEGRALDERGVVGNAVAALYVFDEETGISPEPAYRAVAGEDGFFSFNYLVCGQYALGAFQERDGNLTWDEETEKGGWCFEHVLIGNVNPDFPFVVFLEEVDATSPWLVNAVPLSEHVIEATFSEPVSIPDSTGNHFLLFHPAGDEDDDLPAEIKMEIFPGEKVTEKVLLYTREPLEDGELYSFKVAGIEDRADNTLDSLAVTAEFTALTIQPAVEIPLSYPRRAVGERDTLEVRFGFPLGEDGSVPPFSVGSDSLDISVNGTVSWNDPYTLVFFPRKKWEPVTGLKMTAGPFEHAGELTGEWRAPLIITDSRKTGGIEVSVTISSRIPEGQVEVFIHSGGVKKAGRRLEESETVKFTGLPEGKYMLDAFIDLNGNGRWDAPLKGRDGKPGEPRIRYNGDIGVTRLETTLLAFEIR